MSRARLVILGLTFAAMVLVVIGCGGSKNGGSGGSGDTTKVTLMFAGPKDDEGYNQGSADVGAAIQKAYGDEVEVTYADNVPYTEEAGQVAQQLVNTGTDVIIDTAGYGESLYEVCKKNEEAVDCIVPLPLVLAGEGELTPNMAGFYNEWWKANFVMGAAAGLMTKTNVIGTVNPLSIPLTNSFMNSFLLGCQYTDPDCKMRVITINTYFNPPASSQAADTLADAGADVITGWVNDGSPCVAAQERGLLAVGNYYDYSSACPDASLGTAAWSGTNWNKWFVEQVGLVRDGTFEEKSGGKVHKIPFGEGVEAVLDKKNLPADVRTKVEKIATEIESGELNPFTGPIVDTTGKTRVPAGEEFNLDDPPNADPSLAAGGLIYGWDWQVKGMIGG